MDHKLLLAKCISLIFKESLLKDSQISSRDLVEEAIKKIQPREVGLGFNTDKDTVMALKETVKDLLATSQDHGIDKAGLLQRIRIDVGDNDKLYQALEKGLTEEESPEELRKAIGNGRRSIQKHIDEVRVSEVLTQHIRDWNYGRDKIKNTQEFLASMVNQLAPYSAIKTREDPAMIDSIRLSDSESVRKVVEKIHVSATELRVYKTGFQGIDRMMQGGIRPGEMWVQAALQHKYKTGLSQSIFNGVALYNKPMTNIPGKKPALVAIAFEDTTSERFEFIFKQLMFTELRQFVDVSKITTQQMHDFILSKLSVNGFEVYFYRVNPTKWTYQDLFNLITTLELEHSIEFVLIDYLEKLPTTGCIQSGPTGNDLLDLFTRVRIFFNAKGIAHYTPHQLSVDSKRLIRGQVTEDKFVQALVGRGYYKGSSQLDQIPDGILLSHLFERNGEHFLAVQRDRHRLTSICPEKHKLIYMKFETGMPLPHDLHNDDSSLYKLPPWKGNVDASMYSFE